MNEPSSLNCVDGGLNPIQLMVNWWFGMVVSPYDRDCYFGIPRFESQTTNLPADQFELKKKYGNHQTKSLKIKFPILTINKQTSEWFQPL